ncbi:galactosylceramide sulfotransferase-like isoform X2 [Acanthaster planci]|nr:galactosylceramide sulfotransferase-like isoform X2 [Acanthaster planci]
MGVVMRTFYLVCLLGVLLFICIVLLMESNQHAHKIHEGVHDEHPTWRQRRRPKVHVQKNHRDVNDIFGTMEPSQLRREDDDDEDDNGIFSFKHFSDIGQQTSRDTASVKEEVDANKSDIFSILEGGGSRPHAEVGKSGSKEARQRGMSTGELTNTHRKHMNNNEPNPRQDGSTLAELMPTKQLESTDKIKGGNSLTRRGSKRTLGEESLARTNRPPSNEKVLTGRLDMQNNIVPHVSKQNSDSKTRSQRDGPPMMQQMQRGNLSDAEKHSNRYFNSLSAKKRSEIMAQRRGGAKSLVDQARELSFKMNPQPRLRPVIIDENILKQENASYPPFVKTNATLTRVLAVGSLASGKCKPLNNLAMMKTHKCSSSTLQNILYRWGDDHNLTFVLPKDGPYIGHPQPFDIKHAERVVGDKYNILANHARYNELGLKKVMPSDTVYFTILRDPVKQFESAFTYYKFDERYGVAGLRGFLRQPEIYFQREPVFPRQAGRNQMLYDLGLDARFMDDTSSEVRDYIAMIERNFKVVLIAEYFEESLILLKDLLCWSLDDIVYFNQNARSQSSVRRVTANMRREILDWNAADVSMYNHFNRTLWEKIRRYGLDRMKGEVAQLRLRNELLKKRCIGGKLESHDPRMWYPPGIKVDSFVLKPTARGERLCEQLIRPELTYIDILKAKQRRITAKLDLREEFLRRHAQLRDAQPRRYPRRRSERIRG